MVAPMIDGVYFGEHVCVVALRITIDGTKHPLALVEDSTENTTTVTELLVGLRERGLDATRPIFVGIDGAKALRADRRLEPTALGDDRSQRKLGNWQNLPQNLATSVLIMNLSIRMNAGDGHSEADGCFPSNSLCAQAG